MNYIDRLAVAIGDRCDLDWNDDSRDRTLLRLYAVIGFVRQGAVCLADVHDAWAAWRLEDRPDHPSIRPFWELDPEVQALDEKYARAIAEAWAAVCGPAGP